MDFMIGLVTVALFGFVMYTIYKTPPSSGCSSADAARTRGDKPSISQGGQAGTETGPPAAIPAEPRAREAEAARVSVETAPPGAVPAESLSSQAEAATARSEIMPLAAVPAEPAPAAAADVETSAAAPDLLRNPVTGETAAVPNNYRFAKRWIKEALVAEGLLDRVYGNNELDAEVSEKVKTALKQFRTLTKYQA